MTAWLPETYQWLLVPVQVKPKAPITWEALTLSGADALAVRASKKLRSDELYLTSFAPTRLKMELDRVRLWRGDQVEVRQLVEDFARYLHLPHLKDQNVLLHAVGDGLGLLTWSQDSFAFADTFDDAAGRCKGQRGGQVVTLLDAHAPGMLVKPEVAVRQMDAERATSPPAMTGNVSEQGDTTAPASPVTPAKNEPPPGAALPRHRRARHDSRRPRRRPNRRGGHLAPLRPG